MHIAFLNPQGNFDPGDSYWTEHPDFGGQLVYVKNVALAMAALGHVVDIVTRRIVDPDWPEFGSAVDAYPGHDGVRIVRVEAGDDDGFLAKESLWPYLGRDWVPNIVRFYAAQGALPDAFTGHYGDGGLAGTLLETSTAVPFTFTAHSLGAQKLDKLLDAAGNADDSTLARLDGRYHFGRRLAAEAVAMNRSAFNVTSTMQERSAQYSHPAYHDAVAVGDERRFSVIPPGVDLSIFHPEVTTEDDETIRRVEERLARDLAPERRALPTVVSSSRLDPKKNVTGLVAAFASNPQLREQANLVLLTGSIDDPLHDDGPAGATERSVLSEIRAIAAEGALEGTISGFSIRGQRALAATYRHLAHRRSVFSLTALYEPFGLAPLEAAAAGLPVVVTRNGGPAESLREGDREFGVLVNPADPADIAAGLLRVVGDASAWQAFAAAGRERVLARYTWQRTAEGYVEEIAGAVREPAARRPFELLPIPAYFSDPRPELDFDIAALRARYAGRE